MEFHTYQFQKLFSFQLLGLLWKQYAAGWDIVHIMF